MHTAKLSTQLGDIMIECDNCAVTAVYFCNGDCEAGGDCDNPVLVQCVKQLSEYFSGERQNFDLQLAAHGTPFEMSVWNELTKIPYGKTVTYGYIAEKLGNPAAVRAVGNACGKNPIAVIVPCHRVTGKGGRLTGYAYGLNRKEGLQKLEQANILQSDTGFSV